MAKLSFDAYDIDHLGELEIYLNGQLVDIVPQVESPQWEETWITLEYDVSGMIQAHNELVFTLGAPGRGSSIKNVMLTANGKTLIGDLKTHTVRDELPSFTLTDIQVSTAVGISGTSLMLGIVIGGLLGGGLMWLFRRK